MKKLENREQVLVRMPLDLIEEVKTRADQNERTYNREIVWIVAEFLKQEKAKKKGTESIVTTQSHHLEA